MDKSKVKLTCNVCLNRNYSYMKNKMKTSKLELKKFCPSCGKHTPHKETR